ncbi:MAG: hypothetical protein AAFS07_05495 [Pseudomonadota bacterium]
MDRVLASLVIIAGTIVPSGAIAMELTPRPAGQRTFPGSQYPVIFYAVDLTKERFDKVFSITLVDDGTPTGGGGGIASGFDLDAIVLDRDGDPRTLDDQVRPSRFTFRAGTTRPTSNPYLRPTPERPGPVFGALDATTIDLELATLGVFDARNAAPDFARNGFGALTLGDGGRLTAFFEGGVAVGKGLFVVFGELGGQPGEGLGAAITASDVEAGLGSIRR